MVGDLKRLTSTTEGALRFFLAQSGQPRYGLEIMDAAGLSSGTTYPLLAKLVRIGWLESFPEDVNASEVGRSPRKFYRLTDEGVEAARLFLAKHSRDRSRQAPAVRAMLPGSA